MLFASLGSCSVKLPKVEPQGYVRIQLGFNGEELVGVFPGSSWGYPIVVFFFSFPLIMSRGHPLYDPLCCNPKYFFPQAPHLLGIEPHGRLVRILTLPRGKYFWVWNLGKVVGLLDG